MLKKAARTFGLAIAALFLFIQLIPYGHHRTNPPLRNEPKWDSPETRALAKRACFDCHSNETAWPWYSYVAPVSWLVQRDVQEGRSKLNFSEWDLPQKEAHEAGEVVREGEMPLWFYVPLHPQAALNAEEKQALIHGLETTIGHKEREEDEDGED